MAASDAWRALVHTQAGTAGAARQEGDVVVLAPGLAEKEGLRAGEVATVSYGPDSDGDYLLTAVAPAAAAYARLEEMLSARNRSKRAREELPSKDSAKRQRTGEQQRVSHLLQLSRELQVMMYRCHSRE